MSSLHSPRIRGALLLAAVSVAIAAYAKPPRYEDFPARVWRGRPAPVRMDTVDARMMRTRLREGAREGPNFAGHYTIVIWGCGAMGRSFAIVDARTGRSYFPPEGACIKQIGEEGGDYAEFSKDSRLLVLHGHVYNDSRPGGSQHGTYWYRWDGRRLYRLAANTRYLPPP